MVVDCASADDSVAVARSRPGVVSVALDENLGFGRGSNRRSGAGHRAGHRVRQPGRRADRRVAAGAGAGGSAARGRLLAAGAAGRRRPAPGQRAPRPGLGRRPDRRACAARPAARRRSDRRWPRGARGGPGAVGWAIGAVLAGPTAALRALGPFRRGHLHVRRGPRARAAGRRRPGVADLVLAAARGSCTPAPTAPPPRSGARTSPGWPPRGTPASRRPAASAPPGAMTRVQARHLRVARRAEIAAAPRTPRASATSSPRSGPGVAADQPIGAAQRPATAPSRRQRSSARAPLRKAV